MPDLGCWAGVHLLTGTWAHEECDAGENGDFYRVFYLVVVTVGPPYVPQYAT